MAVRQETGLGQFPKQQSERKKGFLSTIQGRVAAGVVAGTIAFGSFAVYEATQNNNEPGSTPIPGDIIEPSNSSIPTPFLTENPTVTISPSPEVSPTPTTNVEPTPTPTPTETPVPSIEKVPITWPGYARFEDEQYRPYFYLSIDKATVVAKEPIKDGKLLFAITLAADNKAGKINVKCKHDPSNITNGIDRCTFTGATLWIETGKNTRVTDAGQYHTLLGYGPQFIDPYLKVGDKIDGIGISFGKNPRINESAAQLKMNLNSLTKLKASDGKKYPRSDRRFYFYSAGVLLDNS